MTLIRWVFCNLLILAGLFLSLACRKESKVEDENAIEPSQEILLPSVGGSEFLDPGTEIYPGSGLRFINERDRVVAYFTTRPLSSSRNGFIPPIVDFGLIGKKPPKQTDASNTQSQEALQHLGEIKPQEPTPSTTSDPSPLYKLQSNLPTSFDLRSQSLIGPVKNQGADPVCWAFSSLASTETALRSQSDFADLAERHLINTHGFDYSVDQGGNFIMAVAYMSRFSGPTYESEDPFINNNLASPTGALRKAIATEIQFLHPRAGPLDNQAIKNTLYAKASVYTDLYFSAEPAYFHTENSSWNYQGEVTSPNHSVLIVGWDDNYRAANFLVPPPGDGAFIVQNSWGTEIGSITYFYISYYSKVFGVYEIGSVKKVVPVSTYPKIYQFDPLGVTGSITSNSQMTYANIFTTTGPDKLKAIGFWTVSLTPTETYRVRVYRAPAVNQPESGTLVHEANLTGLNQGYHVVPIAQPIQIAKGQRFSAVITTDDGVVLVEAPVAGYSSKALSKSSESFIKVNNQWKDLSRDLPNSNINIKAYAAANETSKPTQTHIPATNARNVARTSRVRIKWSEIVIPGPKYKNAILKRGSTVIPINLLISADGLNLSLVPSSALDPLTTYTVVIPVGAVNDLGGNANNAVTFNFRTGT